MVPSIWLILIEYVVSLFSQILSLYIFGDIVIKVYFYNCRASVLKSPNLTFYFCTQTLVSLVATVYLLYLLCGWRPYPTEYNAYLMYFIGACQSLMITSTPLSVFALGIDRCLSVIFPFQYTKQQNKYPMYFGIAIMATLSAISLIFRIIPAFPITSMTLCGSFGCMTTTKALEIYVFIRYFTSALILITSVTLFVSIRRKLHIYLAHNKAGKSNKLVLCTLLTTLTLDFLPHLASVIFYSVAGINLTSYIGPYSTVIASIESAFCALFYRNVYKIYPLESIFPSQKLTTVSPALVHNKI